MCAWWRDRHGLHDRAGRGLTTMPLSLKAHHPSLPNGAPITVTMAGDTIAVGRGADNDLVLPDPDRVLSKRHCIVERRDESYVVTDVSTNGTFLNYQPDRLDAAPTPLKTGDVILVGEFELVVDISPGQPDAASDDLAPDWPQLSIDPTPLVGSDDDDSAFLDELLGSPAIPSQSEASGPRLEPSFQTPKPGASAPDHTPAERDHFVAPRAVNSAIPDDWDDSLIAPSDGRTDPDEPAPIPRPPSAQDPQSADTDAALQAFVAGLGVAGLHVPPDQAEQVMGRMGRVMATMIAGMREIMMARAALKSEMRVARTMIEANQNNPLKFSVSVEQAIEAMVQPTGRGYQDPETATAEVLRDIKAHEIATMTGMQAALTDLLTQLGPEQLSARIEKTSGFAALLGNRKARSWEAYERHYAQLARQTEDNFQSTFGKEFSRAYEHQITKL